MYPRQSIHVALSLFKLMFPIESIDYIYTWKLWYYHATLFMACMPSIKMRRISMRLVTYHDGSGAHLGALHGDTVVALDAVAPSMLALIDGGPELLAQARAALESATATLPLSAVRLLAPIPRPRQNIVCLGM